MPDDHDPLSEIESIAAEADTYGAARHLGELNKAFESGKLTRYLVAYEVMGEDECPHFRVYWTSAEDLWARGALGLADEIIADALWAHVEQVEDD